MTAAEPDEKKVSKRARALRRLASRTGGEVVLRDLFGLDLVELQAGAGVLGRRVASEQEGHQDVRPIAAPEEDLLSHLLVC